LLHRRYGSGIIQRLLFYWVDNQATHQTSEVPVPSRRDFLLGAFMDALSNSRPLRRQKTFSKWQPRVIKDPGTTVGARCHDRLMKLLDDFRRNEPDLPTRATALRRLAIVGLTAKRRNGNAWS
jgi:hypothetical protein